MTLSEHQVIASICRSSFFDFVKEFWGTIIHEPPIFNWHVKYLCDELQIVAERVFKNLPKEYDLVINVPPGSTKSTICSQMFPAWVWTRMPYAQLIHISYAYMIAQKDSINTRDIVQSELYQKCFPGIQLREDENTKGLFMNTRRGYRLSVGMGGAITGKHGHFLVVDDPINPQEAFSEVELRNANRWMESTLPTRKVNKEVVPTILIQQRLHQADPSGEMLAKNKGKGVRHINLPGEVTKRISPPELAKNYQDGLLDPIRLSRTMLDNMKKDLGEYGYAAQFLQEPVPLGGGMFKIDFFKQVENYDPKQLLRIVRSWDKAGTKDGGAYSVGLLMATQRDGSYIILDVVRGQWAATQREAIIDATAEDDGHDVEIELEVEGGSGGKESGEGTADRLRKKGHKVHIHHPTGDKESRAYQFASQVGAGNVYLLIRPWTEEMLEEYRFFPHSKYKDQIDAGSGGFNRLFKRRVKIGSW